MQEIKDLMTIEFNNKIKEAVFQTLEDVLNISRNKINLTDQLISDLKMDSDDASFDFALGLEKKLGLKIPAEEWSKVWTVEDAINLLIKYKRDKG